MFSQVPKPKPHVAQRGSGTPRRKAKAKAKAKEWRRAHQTRSDKWTVRIDGDKRISTLDQKGTPIGSY